MTSLPALHPKSRNYTPGVFATKRYESLSGAGSTRLYGSKPFDSKLSLEFECGDEEVQMFFNSWYSRYGDYKHLNLPEAYFAGMPKGIFACGLEWHWDSEPKITSVQPHWSRVKVEFVGRLEIQSDISDGGYQESDMPPYGTSSRPNRPGYFPRPEPDPEPAPEPMVWITCAEFGGAPLYASFTNCDGKESYQWQKKNGSDWVDIPGATDSTYETEQAGTYRCVGECSGITSWSNVCTLAELPEPEPEPEITSFSIICGDPDAEPPSVGIACGTYTGDTLTATLNNCEGGNGAYTMEAVFENCNSGKDYQWQVLYSDSVYDSWENLEGFTDSKCSYSEPGTYRCKGWCGEQEYTSNNCTIQSKGNTPTPEPTPDPTFELITCATYVGELLEARFTDCTSLAMYQWQKKNGESWEDITDAISQDYVPTEAGTYRCKGWCGETEYTSDECTVIDLPPDPTISITCGTYTGDTLTATINDCTANASYQWQKDSVDISGATSATYAPTEAGSFRCVGLCGETQLTSDACTITVRPPDPSISITCGTYTGDTLTATVSDCTEGVSYQWQKDGVDIQGATSATYAPTEAGSYRCVALCGETQLTSDACAITVRPPDPTISITCGTYTGDTLTATIDNCNANASYQWQKDNVDISGATNATFVPTEAGSYRCKGLCGETQLTSDACSIAVRPPDPSISIVCGTYTGDTLTATIANCNANASYQWQKDNVDIQGATSATYTPTAAGSYRCKGLCGETALTSDACSIAVRPPDPSISIQCTEFVGGTLTATIADCSAGASYQWQQLIGETWTDILIGTEATWIVVQAGQYRCKGLCGETQLVSDSCTIEDAPLPVTFSITCAEINGTMTATMENCTANVQYTWQYKLGDVWTTMAGNGNTCTAWAEGDWRCKGLCGETEYISNVCTVDPPLVNVEVIIDCADEGGTLSVTVTGCDGPAYQWQKSTGGSWNNINGATASTYLVPVEGIYRCRVTCGGITVYSDQCDAADTDKPLTCPEPKYDVLRAPNPINRMRWAVGQKVDYLWELKSVDLLRGWSWPSHCDWGWMDQLFIYPCNEGGQRLGKDCRYWGHYSWANDTEGLDDYMLYEECFSGSGGTPTFQEGQYIMGIFHKNLSPENSKDPCNGNTLPDGFPGPTPPGGNPYPDCYPTCWPDNGVGHGDRYMPKTKAVLDSLGEPFRKADAQSGLIWTGYPPIPQEDQE